MITHLELMTKHGIGDGDKSVNVVAPQVHMQYEGEVSPPRYEEDYQYMAGQVGGSCSGYQ
ncbi:hypothetical protein HAX54_021676, partial [Datura stramonium]|nr:hypothetical protein [Datura stramonium]